MRFLVKVKKQISNSKEESKPEIIQDNGTLFHFGVGVMQPLTVANKPKLFISVALLLLVFPRLASALSSSNKIIHIQATVS